MLQQFYGYVKGADESIDKMASTLNTLSNEIGENSPELRPHNVAKAVVIMNACQGEEYRMAKFTLNQAEPFNSTVVIEMLRTVEQEGLRKDAANLAAKGGRKPGS